MGLTEQVTSTITIATHKPVRNFKFRKLNIECVKAYVDNKLFRNESLQYIRILDAIKDIKHIPGKNQQDIYDTILKQHLSLYSEIVLTKIVSLAIHYPPRVRKVLSDMLDDLNRAELHLEISGSIIPTTRFNFSYERNKTYESTY